MKIGRRWSGISSGPKYNKKLGFHSRICRKSWLKKEATPKAKTNSDKRLFQESNPCKKQVSTNPSENQPTIAKIPKASFNKENRDQTLPTSRGLLLSLTTKQIQDTKLQSTRCIRAYLLWILARRYCLVCSKLMIRLSNRNYSRKTIFFIRKNPRISMNLYRLLSKLKSSDN